MGVNVVEREGISFSHPSRFILVGTMNPEEGDLRPQLLDRFALCVEIHGISDADRRVAVLERRILYEQNPEVFAGQWLDQENSLSHEIAQAREPPAPGQVYAKRPLYHCPTDRQLPGGWPPRRYRHPKNGARPCRL